MTEKVHLVREDHLPVPLLLLASPEDLAAWYAGQLRWALDRGERELSISCFDTGPTLGFDAGSAARAVLKAVTDVLYDRPEAERLTIFCIGEASFRAYSFYWNMLYAETKPPHNT